MSNQDAQTVHKKSRFALSIPAAIGMILVGSGCIIVRVPPPKKNDPFQPPPATAITMKKGDTHRMRLNCGTKATFQAAGPVEGWTMEYKADNLSSVKQVPSAAIRFNWTGPGMVMDVPITSGTQSSRSTSGNVTITGGAGQHTFVVSMASGSDCGPVNFKVIFR